MSFAGNNQSVPSLGEPDDVKAPNSTVITFQSYQAFITSLGTKWQILLGNRLLFVTREEH